MADMSKKPFSKEEAEERKRLATSVLIGLLAGREPGKPIDRPEVVKEAYLIADELRKQGKAEERDEGDEWVVTKPPPPPNFIPFNPR